MLKLDKSMASVSTVKGAEMQTSCCCMMKDATGKDRRRGDDYGWTWSVKKNKAETGAQLGCGIL